MAQDLTQIVDFPTHIPEHDDHMVVGVDVKFVVKSTYEHPYHHTVYSYSKAVWLGWVEGSS